MSLRMAEQTILKSELKADSEYAFREKRVASDRLRSPHGNAADRKSAAGKAIFGDTFGDTLYRNLVRFGAIRYEG